MVIEIKPCWYRFAPASMFNKKQLGVIPQVEHYQGDIHIIGNNHKGLVYNLDQKDRYPPEFIVPKFIANKGAKDSDFIQNSALTTGAIIISEKCKKLFYKFNLPEHEMFECKVSLNGMDNLYYLLHFYTSNLEYIDFEKTVFKYDYGLPLPHIVAKYNKEEKLKFKDYEEYIKKKNELDEFVFFSFAPLVFLEGDNRMTNLDLLFFNQGTIWFFINNRFKEELINNKINAWAIGSANEYYSHGVRLEYKAF